MLSRLSARVVLASLAFLLAATGVASAQVGSGTLVGTVRDASSQKPIADVVVTVTSPALQGEEIAVTGKNGDFRVGGLPPGDYEIRMDKESFRPYSRGGVRVRADVTLRVDTQLLPEDLKTDIVVVARAPTVDVGSTQTGSNIDKDFIQRVPAVRPGGKGSDTRSIESIAATAPQAKADDYGTSISGTTSPENNYVIDGLGVGDPAYGTLGTPMSIEFVDELNIITGGYLPEYGKSTGGILNAITKSGGDDFELGFWGFYSPAGLIADGKDVRRQGDTIDTQTDVGDIFDFGLSVGGPIAKEKLWFYLGVDYAVVHWDLTRSLRRILYDADFNPLVDPDTGFTQTELIPGTTDKLLAETRTLQAFGKLSWRIDKSNRLSLSLLGSPRWSGGDGDYGMDSRDGAPEADALIGTYTALAHRYDGGSFDVVAKWNSDLIDDLLLLETSVGWHHQQNGRFPSDGSAVGSNDGLAGIPMVHYRRAPANHDIRDFEELPNPEICDAPEGAPEGTIPCPLQTYFLGGPDFLSDESLNRFGARTVLSWLPEWAGTHVIKVGLDYDYMSYDITKAYSGGRRYRESLGGGSFTDIRGFGFLAGPDEAVQLDSVGSAVSSHALGAFLQDSWTLTKGFTANLGIRWDSQFLLNDYGETVIALPDQFSPRAGFVWDPTTDGGAKIYANLALFYESIPLDVADRAGSGEPQIISVHAAGDNCDPSDPAQTEPGGACNNDENRLVVNGPSSPDKLWIINGGGRTPVDPDLDAQSSWEFVAGAEYDIGRIADVLKNLRAGVLYTKRWMNNVIEDMSRDEAQTYFIGNPGKGIAKDFPEAERNYDAFTFYVMKEFSECWLLQGSYTLSWLDGNYAGLFRPETAQLDPNINSDFDLKSLTVNRTGPLPGDTRHQFKVFGAHDVELAKGHHLLPGYGLSLRSGGPTNYLASHVLYGSDEVFLLPRGSGKRLPWVASIDLSLGYQVQVTDTFQLGFTVEVFNVFNFQAPTSKSQRYTNADANPIINGSKEDLSGAVDIDGNAIEVNPNFGNTTGYQRPRTFRFGIRGTL